MELIKLENLSYQVESRREPILNNISNTIHQGEYLCIVGTNGSGKSTLIRHFNGLIRPTSGEVHIHGRGLNNPENICYAREILGMVFQNPLNQIVSTVVEEEIAFGLENLGWTRDRIDQKIDEVLQNMEMQNFRFHSTSQLSAGQQQRIALAGVLAMEPQCLILDEATSMLNPTGRKDLLDRVDNLHKQGKTIISVTHHLEELLRADRVWVMQQGKLLCDCIPQELLRSDHLESLGLLPLPWTQLGSRMGIKQAELPLTLNDLFSLIDWENPPEERKDFPEPQESMAKVRDLAFQYPQGEWALEDINLDLYRGERLILTGETGSGKSTLLHLLAGVRKPDSGSIQWDNNSLLKGLALQNPETQLFKLFVGDDVAYGPANQGLSGKELARKVRDAMNMAGLPFNEFKNRKIRELSGGEKRKAALAGILAMEPEILLLDEPTAGLDPQAREQLNHMLNRLQYRGTTLVISTHDMNEAVQGDRILHLHKGHINILENSQSFFFQQRQALLPPPAAELIQMAWKQGYSWPGISRWNDLEKMLMDRRVGL